VALGYALTAIAGGVAETYWLLKAAFIPLNSIGLVIAVARIRMPYTILKEKLNKQRCMDYYSVD
jgi:hypothetical protein